MDIRGAYAFLGLSGPEDARAKMPWTREELSKAGQGPSIVGPVPITAGTSNLLYRRVKK